MRTQKTKHASNKCASWPCSGVSWVRVSASSAAEMIAASASSCCGTNSPIWKNGLFRPAQLAELEASHKRLANASKLTEGITGVVELLDGDSELALRPSLVRTHAELSRLATLDDRLAPMLELLDNAQIQLNEAVDGLEHYAQDVDLDPERYAEVDTHLARLHELSRRHRLPVIELDDKRIALQTELSELENAGEALERLGTQRGPTSARLRQSRRRTRQVSPGRIQTLEQRSKRADDRIGHGRRRAADCVGAR